MSFISHRIQEMRRASFMKYGDNIQGEFFPFFLECVLNNEVITLNSVQK